MRRSETLDKTDVIEMGRKSPFHTVSTGAIYSAEFHLDLSNMSLPWSKNLENALS